MSSRIDDAGEKIGGARKDWNNRALDMEDLGGMTAEEAAELVRKEAVWPVPDYEAMVEGGTAPEAAALIKIIRDRMAAKPNYKILQLGTRDLRSPALIASDFLRMTEKVRDSLVQARTPQDVKDAFHRVYEAIGWQDGWRNNETRHLAASIRKGRACPLRVTSRDVSKANAMVAEGFPAKVPAWRKGVKLIPRSDGTLTAVKGKKIIGGGFLTKEEAFEHVRQKAEEKRASSKNKLAEPQRPKLTQIERSGLPDHRKGRDISAEEFIETFGFRGVEFGLWLPDNERQEVLNQAYDGLLDLADVMEVDPRALSLDGTIAAAFGARGSGRNAAHYEPGRKVINITRLSGAGALAHEFAHALDHWCGTVDASERNSHPGGIPSGSGWHQIWRERTQYLTNLDPDTAQSWEVLMGVILTRMRGQAEEIEHYFKAIESVEEKMRQQVQSRDQYLRIVAQRDGAKPDRKYLKKVEDWLSYIRGRKAKLEEAMNEVIAGERAPGWTATAFMREAQKLSGKSGDYWTRPTELFARAFECFVFDEIARKGGESPYLVHGVEADRYAQGYKGNPYPTGWERVTINDQISFVIQSLRPRLQQGLVPEENLSAQNM